ncbi:P2 [Pneumonia virus of mice 15]|uniref:p2 n=1 Tax=Murine pneumonia virus (strain 15) TaxID=296738 RepID=Q5MKM6_MPV15|nr:P2 [Pneumonia virus of mice 15]
MSPNITCPLYCVAHSNSLPRELLQILLNPLLPLPLHHPHLPRTRKSSPKSLMLTLRLCMSVRFLTIRNTARSHAAQMIPILRKLGSRWSPLWNPRRNLSDWELACTGRPCRPLLLMVMMKKATYRLRRLTKSRVLHL